MTSSETIQCRAAVAWKVNQPFTIETVEVAAPKAKEVRIKMASSGVCHSDLHDLEGIDKNYPLPGVFGHEGAGIIESVGSGVTEFAPGDVVVLCFVSHCGECDYCNSSSTHLCRKTPSNHFQMDGTSRIRLNGRELSQMNSISTFSEYTVTSIFNVAKVNPKADLRSLCLAGCSLPTGYGAVVNAAQISPGSTCAVWGLGGIGMCAIMACRNIGAKRIVGVDTNPRKFVLAKQFGCTDFLNPASEDVRKVLSEMLNGGPDFCFVCVGSIPAMEEAFQSSHPAWGKTVVVGITDKGASVKVGIWELLFGRKLSGTHYGGYKAKIYIPSLVEMVLDGQIELEKLISHRLSLNRINEGFEMLKTGESLRAIVEFGL